MAALTPIPMSRGVQSDLLIQKGLPTVVGGLTQRNRLQSLGQGFLVAVVAQKEIPTIFQMNLAAKA